MYKQKITLGIVPTKRAMLSLEVATAQKEEFMAAIKAMKPDVYEYVDIDDICTNGIAFKPEDTAAVIAKMKDAKIDALFVPFCDFGEEQVAAAIAGAFTVPTLVWGPRDTAPNTNTSRGRDTQCGIFAATKVMRRFGVNYSYITNCPTDSKKFRDGFMTFLRAAAIVKALNGLRVAKIGARPASFMSVMTNEAALIKKFGMVTVPISAHTVAARAKEMIANNEEAFAEYYADLTSRIDFSNLTEEKGKAVAGIKMAIQELMEKNNCTVAAMECWSAFNGLIGAPPCLAAGEMADLGIPLACETDVNGAISMAILRAAALYEEPVFLADLTIRHPENDNAELLWHCGPFPYSLKDENCKAGMEVGGQEHWYLKQGNITVARFDDLNDEYYLFAGEGKSTTGPETTGTYVWFEVDNWEKWEDRLMYGPYIHHIGGVYGNFQPALKEAARLLGLTYDHPDADGPRSL